MATIHHALRARPLLILAGLLLIIATVAAACGGDDSDDAAPAASSSDSAPAGDAEEQSAPAQPAEQAPADAPAGSTPTLPSYPPGQEPADDEDAENVESEGSGKTGPSAVVVADPDDARNDTPNDDAAPREPAAPTAPSEIGDTERILIPSDHAAGDEFGWSADTDGVRVISGAPFHDDQGAQSGAAYIFLRDEAGNWIEEAELLPDDGEAGAWFGRWTAIDGDVAVIGAPLADVVGDDDDSGAAYVFERIDDQWQQTARLVASLPKGGNQFGWSVDLDGDTIIVSASNDGDGGGQRVYVFRRTGDRWVEEATLVASDLAADFFFGQDIGIAGDTIVAGAKGRDTVAGANSGAVYVFQRTDAGWIETARLLPDDPFVFDLFGRAVAIASDAIAGDTIVVGAYLEDEAGPDGGSVYVFERDPDAETGWRQTAKLIGASTGEMDWFGYELDTDGRTLVVGAPHTNRRVPEIIHSGLTTVFARSDGGWEQIAELQAGDATSAGGSADYGWAIAVHSDIIMVGAWLADTEAGVDGGRAYIYTLPDPVSP